MKFYTAHGLTYYVHGPRELSEEEFIRLYEAYNISKGELAIRVLDDVGDEFIFIQTKELK